MTGASSIAESLTAAQRRVIQHLTPDPEPARKGGAWSPIAAFNLVGPGLVKLHQSYLGDRYSITKRGLAVRKILQEKDSG
jgi:hypothetical protein